MRELSDNLLSPTARRRDQETLQNQVTRLCAGQHISTVLKTSLQEQEPKRGEIVIATGTTLPPNLVTGPNSDPTEVDVELVFTAYEKGKPDTRDVSVLRVQIKDPPIP